MVADEVRTLASRTQSSTQEIQQMIETIQSCSSDAERVMAGGREIALRSVQKTQDVRQQLEKIGEVVGGIKDMSTAIASAVEQQSVVSREVSSSVEQIAKLSGHTVELADRSAQSGDNLATLAAELQALVLRFRS